MTSTRLTSFAVCLSLAWFLLAGNVWAGTTVATELVYAREVGTLGTLYDIPAGNSIVRVMGVLRQAASGNFFLRLTLSDNAEFAAGGLPVAGDLTQTAGTPAGNLSITVSTAAADGATTVEWTVIVGPGDFTALPTLRLDTSAWRIRDVDNILGGGGTIQATIMTRNANTGFIFDSGTDTDDWLKGDFGVKVTSPLAATTATVDVATAGKNFVPGGPAPSDTLVQDNGVTLGIDASVVGTLTLTGGPYALVTGDSVDLVVTGDLSGITSIIWDIGGVDPRVYPVTAAEVTANSATLSIPGGSASLDGASRAIRIIVDGTTGLSDRTLNLTAKLKLSGSAGGLSANNRTLVTTSVLTVWSLNGTILIANFQNGNTDVFASRIYLLNSSAGAGAITARVWTLPVAGNPESLLGTVSLGSMGAGAGRNIKLKEDILAKIPGLTLPYTDDGGNVVVELTIEAHKVTGVGQVFNATTLASFGIFPLLSP